MPETFLTLEQLYAYWPQLASSGPSDEGIRLIIADAQAVVLSDLRNLGWDTERLDEKALPQLRRMVLFRTLAEILVSPAVARASPELAQYYETKYRMELRDLSLRPERMGETPRIRADLPLVKNRPVEKESLLERIRRLRPGT